MKIQTKNINNHIKRHHKKYLFGIFLGGIGFFIVKALILLTSLFGIFNYNPTLADGPTTYYVSASGDDSNNGTSISTPRKTLTKVNAQTLLPGDSILFKRGDIFTGSLIFTGSESGTSTDPIILSAYGTGDNPVLNGFEVLSSWMNMGSGIYKSICSSCSGSLNMLTIDGVNTPMGRYPNVNYADGGYLTFESFVHNTSITDNELTSTINWSGADVVIRKNRRVMDRAPIISHSGGTITYNSPTSFGELNGFGYFLQNDIRTLDQNGERYFNPVDKSIQIYLGSDNPNDFVIKAASIDNLVSINGPDYIVFSGMTFEGANNYAFYLPNFSFSNYITIKNSVINLIGDSAIYDRHSSYLTLENSLIKNINNQGYGSINNNNTTIRNNIFRDIGLFAGMGAYGGSSFHAIQLYGAGGFTIDSNIIENIGYIPINFFGDNSVAKNNFISGYCLIKDDGAGIYIYADSSAGTGKIYTGHKMLDNIIINGGGRLAKKGVSASDSGSSSANGLYTDGVMNSVEIARNTVANIGGYGIHMNNPRFNNIHDNVFYNSRKGGIDFSNLNSNTGFLPSGNIVNNNTVYITDKDQPNVNLSDGYGQYLLDFGNTNTITNNRYVQLHQSMPIFKVQVMPWNVRRYPFSQRKEVVNADISSQLISTNVSSYKINFLTGANKISNGSFSTGLGSFICYSMGTCNISRDSSSSLDSGALKFVYNTGSITNQDYVTRAIGSISSGKNYILKFSAVGLYSGDVIGVDIRRTDPDWRTLIPLQYIQINNHRTEYELLFSSTLDYSTTSIDFRLVGYTGGTIWLDNIELYEADILPTNLDDYILFDYNASTGEKTVNLTNSYRDIFGSIYSDSTIIQPYSSIVLFKIPDKPTFNVVTISGSSVVDINYSADSFKKEYSLDGLVYLDYTGSIVISDSVTIYAKGQDIDGNRSDISDYIITVANDQVAPIGTISYSTTGMTSGNVTVTISLNESGTITNNGGSDSYTFTNNGDFTFTYKDLAGNTGSETVSVSRIDNVLPTITGVTSGGIYTSTATFSATDNIGVMGVTLDGTSLQSWTNYTISTIGLHTIIVNDLVGNISSTTFEIQSEPTANDQVAPIGTISYSTTGITSGNVTVTISLNENGTITNNGGSNSYIFTNNGDFTFTYEDLAGNTGSETASVSWIDKDSPIGTISYSTTGMTSGNVTVTISLNESGTITNNGGSDSYTFTNNGDFTFTYKDLAGNTGSETVSVSRIDNVLPTITGVTSGGIYTSTATFSATDNIGVMGVTLDGTSLQSWTNYTISTIGLHTIIVNDLVGNISSITFEIKASSSVGGGGGGGGGGGSSKTKDNCPNGDYSTSYYDSKCGTNPNIIQSGSYSGFSNSVIKSIIPPSIVNLEDIPTKQDIINNMQVHASAQTKNELAEAYQFALENKLTTITNIEKVGFTGILTRIQMAKMISNYTINVMGKTGIITNASKCSFDDLKPVSSELKIYAIISCQLGLMGMDSRGGINKNFNPFAEVTRAQFGTILSRSIRGDKYNKAGLDYYTEHLKELNKKGIVNYISGNPAERKELRGWAMIMMKRASEK